MPDTYVVVVEIPGGSRNKYEYDHESGAIFLDRLNRRVAIQHPVQLGRVLVVSQRCIGLAHTNTVVTSDIDLRTNLKRSLELQRLSVRQLHIEQLRLRYGAQLLLRDRLPEPL